VVLALAARTFFGLAPTEAVVVGLALSLSSTAFALQILAERRELATAHGRASFAILLFQDLAAIPMLAVFPLLGPFAVVDGSASTWFDVGQAVAVIAAVIVGGKYLLRYVLKVVAWSRVQEVFTAMALFTVIGVALLMDLVGLSMALGAFLAGVLLAESEYRHELEADIEPFKGLLLGLFFMAVGMSIDLGLLAREPVLVLAATAGLMGIKAAVMFVLARLFRLPRRPAAALAVVLAQGGEFAFVLFNLAVGAGLFEAELGARLNLIVALSMAATPIAYWLYERAAQRAAGAGAARPFDTIEPREHKVVIAGFGRFGQIVARILNMASIQFTALDANPNLVDFVKRFGNEVYYGDPQRLDLLRTARVDLATAFVLAVDDPEASMAIAATVRQHFPHVPLYARARDRQHALRLLSVGAKVVVRDTLYSSMHLTGDLLTGLEFSVSESRRVVSMFEAHDAALLHRQLAIRDDEQALVQSAREAAEQLRELFESDAATQVD
jgi:glutathione-regulated potassium-efflux system protein KefB